MSSLVFQIGEKFVSSDEFPSSARSSVNEISKNFSFYCKGEYGESACDALIVPPSVSGDPDNPHRDLNRHIKTTVSYFTEKHERRISLYFYSDPNFQLFTAGPTDPIAADCYLTLEHHHPISEFEEMQRTHGKVIEFITSPDGIESQTKGILYTRACFEESLETAMKYSKKLSDNTVNNIFSLKAPSIILSRVMNEVLKQVDRRNVHSRNDEETSVLHFESVMPVNSIGFFEVNLFTLVGPPAYRKSELAINTGKFCRESHLVGVFLNPHGFLKAEWKDVDIKAA